MLLLFLLFSLVIKTWRISSISPNIFVRQTELLLEKLGSKVLFFLLLSSDSIIRVFKAELNRLIDVILKAVVMSRLIQVLDLWHKYSKQTLLLLFSFCSDWFVITRIRFCLFWSCDHIPYCMTNFVMRCIFTRHVPLFCVWVFFNKSCSWLIYRFSQGCNHSTFIYGRFPVQISLSRWFYQLLKFSITSIILVGYHPVLSIE